MHCGPLAVFQDYLDQPTMATRPTPGFPVIWPLIVDILSCPILQVSRLLVLRPFLLLLLPCL
jgi:hypothetical protein